MERCTLKLQHISHSPFYFWTIPPSLNIQEPLRPHLADWLGLLDKGTGRTGWVSGRGGSRVRRAGRGALWSHFLSSTAWGQQDSCRKWKTTGQRFCSKLPGFSPHTILGKLLRATRSTLNTHASSCLRRPCPIWTET